MVGPQPIPTFVCRLPQTRAAFAYAEQRHAGQCRSDGTPFILHPLDVAGLLNDAGAPDHLIAAGVMHDLVEKANVSSADLQERFGPQITSLVLAVSDDDRIGGYGARKAALRRQVSGAGEEALMLFAADKLSKLRELRREAAADAAEAAEAGPPEPVRALRARRLRHYQRSLAMLEERLPGSPLVEAFSNELDALRSDRTPSVAPDRPLREQAGLTQPP